MLESDAIKGRGASANPANRFERLHYACHPDMRPFNIPAPCTQFFRDFTRTIIARNDSPDVPYDASINPYRGCEHGCIYCYARPYHEYLGFSAVLDFGNAHPRQGRRSASLAQGTAVQKMAAANVGPLRRHRSLSADRTSFAIDAPLSGSPGRVSQPGRRRHQESPGDRAMWIISANWPGIARPWSTWA